MEPHQERVIVEKLELDEKIVSLTKFLRNRIFASLDEYEKERLTRQLEYMEGYSSMLTERIAAFHKA